MFDHERLEVFVIALRFDSGSVVACIA